MKDAFNVFRVASLVAIGLIAIGSSVSEAAAKRKSGVTEAANPGRTASSYRKPIQVSASPKRGHPSHKGSGRLQTQPTQ